MADGSRSRHRASRPTSVRDCLPGDRVASAAAGVGGVLAIVIAVLTGGLGAFLVVLSHMMTGGDEQRADVRGLAWFFGAPSLAVAVVATAAAVALLRSPPDDRSGPND